MTPDSIASDGNAVTLVMGTDVVLIVLIFTAGCTIGLLAKYFVNHWVAGAMIKVLKPLKPGDLISCNTITGKVESIGWCQTILAGADNTKLIIPNNLLMANSIISHPRVNRCRINIRFGVAPEEDIDAALDIIEEVLSKNQAILPDPAYTVAKEAACACGVVLRAQFWIAGIDHSQVHSDTIASVEALFDAEGIQGHRLEERNACSCRHRRYTNGQGHQGAGSMDDPVTCVENSP